VATSSPTDLDGAAAAAQEKQARHSARDFAGEWLLFTKELRDNITQKAFVEYSEACTTSPGGSGIGPNAKMTGKRLDSPGKAVIRFEMLGFSKAVTMVYENGGWYKDPDDFLKSNYGKSGSELIAADVSVGGC
jgi:hypothetical protein